MNETRPDWVWKEVVTLSDHWLYEILVKEVRRDVERMNELVTHIKDRHPAQFEIDEKPERFSLSVACRPEGYDQLFGTCHLSVSNGHVRVHVPEEAPIDPFGKSRLALDAEARWEDGNCEIVPKSGGKILQPWQVSMALLADLFFARR